MSQYGTLGGSVNPRNRNPYIFNQEPQFLARLRGGIADVNAGVANAHLLCMGDSTTFGGGGGTGTAIKPASYPTQLAQRLTARGLRSGWQSFAGSSNPGTSMVAADARVTISGGMAPTGILGVGGGYFAATTVGSITFAPSSQVDTCQFKYLGTAGLSFSYSVDGGAPTVVSPTASASSVQTLTIPAGSLGTHTFTINWVAGALYVGGFIAYNSAAKELCVINAGWSGSEVRSYKNTASNNQYDMLNALPTWGASGVIVALGINSWANNISLAEYTAAYQVLLTAIKANSDPIIVTPIPSSTTWASVAAQQTYIDAMYQLALTNDCVLIDNWKLWKDYTTANGLGWMTDTLHGSRRGYGIFAASLSEFIITL